jgi:diguanylate cyclase (GGDEF)-like protein
VTGGGVSERGALATVPAHIAPGPQESFRRELISTMMRHSPSLDHLLGLLDRRVAGMAGLTGATVFSFESDSGRPLAVAELGAPSPDPSRAAEVLRRPSAEPCLSIDGGVAIRLQMGGQTLGVLELQGSRLDVLTPDTLGALALTVASALQGLLAEDQRRFIAHASDTIRRLFESATAATDVETAATLLARSAAEAFRTERAGLYLLDTNGMIRHAVGVGVSPAESDALARSLVGKRADQSPVWAATGALRAPTLIDDGSSIEVRPGGFVQTLGLSSWVAMPLLSAAGPVGLVICGDVSRTRRWTIRDQDLASSLAVEGSLIMDSARMREAERTHLAELTRLAFHDALTGLPNRSYLLDRAGQAVARAANRGGRTGLLLIDLDGFKAVNDTAGHHAGDLLLTAVGRRLQGAVRDGDVVARLGGDEFAILLAADPDASSATAVAERVHQRLREPFRIEEREIAIGGSVGIALFPDHAPDVEGLLRAADSQMYRAKRDGGGIRSAL